VQDSRPAGGAWSDDVRVTASIGIATFTGTTAEDLLERADRALYQAKRQGKNRLRESPAAADAPMPGEAVSAPQRPEETTGPAPASVAPVAAAEALPSMPTAPPDDSDRLAPLAGAPPAAAL
jgi:hypothetical protein